MNDVMSTLTVSTPRVVTRVSVSSATMTTEHTAKVFIIRRTFFTLAVPAVQTGHSRERGGEACAVVARGSHPATVSYPLKTIRE